MGMNRFFASPLSQFLAAVLAGGLVLTAFIAADLPERERQASEERLDVINLAAGKRAELESAVTKHLQISTAFASLISVRGFLDDAEFHEIAKAMEAQAPSMRNLGISQGTIIRQVYPLQGNEAILGVDYRELPNQWQQVEQAIVNHHPVMAGPLRLVQGGNGLIQRAPIFDTNGKKFLGIVSLVLDSDKLFGSVGLQQAGRVHFAIAKVAPGINVEDIIFGSPSVAQLNPIRLDVQAPGAQWVLLAAPAMGWGQGTHNNLLRLVVQCFVSFLIGLGVFALLSYLARLQAALGQLETQKRQLIEAQRVAQMGHFEWTPRHSSMKWSDQLFAIVGQGYRDAPMLADDFWRVIHPDDRPTVADALQQLMLEPMKVSHTIRIVRMGGGLRWCLLTLIRPDEVISTGEDIHLIGTLTDITERHQEDEERRRMVQRLHRSNEELQQFAWVASHSIQEPLRMIGSYLQLLERRYGPQLDEDARAFIGFATRGAKRMQNLIIDLLAYSRLTSDDGPMEAVDLGDVVGKIRLHLGDALTAPDVTLTAGPLPTVMGWPDQLSSLLQNLIVNSLQYRDPHRPLVISLDSERSGPQWKISISDTGQGIDPAFHQQIFKIFSRLSADYETEGTGIGLALCRRIVERHGGTLWVESEVGKGATFTFTLPPVR
jgi:signal transduction histidine kinase